MARLHRSKIMAVATLLAASVAACSPTADEPAPAPDPALIEQSAALADRFQAQLQQELSGALQSVGPVGAIGVCEAVAPAIAQQLSDESGAIVRRVARRNRNPGNGLDTGYEAFYSELEKAPVTDGAPSVVHGEIDGRFVYMRAIPMKEKPCAACHGTSIAPEVQAAIAQSYPADRATGFKPGELRGAFVIEQAAAQ